MLGDGTAKTVVFADETWLVRPVSGAPLSPARSLSRAGRHIATAFHGVVCFTGMLSNAWTVRDFYPIDYLPRGVRLTAYRRRGRRSASRSLTAFPRQRRRRPAARAAQSHVQPRRDRGRPCQYGGRQRDRQARRRPLKSSPCAWALQSANRSRATRGFATVRDAMSCPLFKILCLGVITQC